MSLRETSDEENNRSNCRWAAQGILLRRQAIRRRSPQERQTPRQVEVLLPQRRAQSCRQVCGGRIGRRLGVATGEWPASASRVVQGRQASGSVEALLREWAALG